MKRLIDRFQNTVNSHFRKYSNIHFYSKIHYIKLWIFIKSQKISITVCLSSLIFASTAFGVPIEFCPMKIYFKKKNHGDFLKNTILYLSFFYFSKKINKLKKTKMLFFRLSIISIISSWYLWDFFWEKRETCVLG